MIASGRVVTTQYINKTSKTALSLCGGKCRIKSFWLWLWVGPERSKGGKCSRPKHPQQTPSLWLSHSIPANLGISCYRLVTVAPGTATHCGHWKAAHATRSVRSKFAISTCLNNTVVVCISFLVAATSSNLWSMQHSQRGCGRPPLWLACHLKFCEIGETPWGTQIHSNPCNSKGWDICKLDQQAET